MTAKKQGRKPVPKVEAIPISELTDEFLSKLLDSPATPAVREHTPELAQTIDDWREQP